MAFHLMRFSYTPETWAKLMLAIAAGGALAWTETTVLMTVEEMLEALAKGKGIGYRRPGASPAT